MAEVWSKTFAEYVQRFLRRERRDSDGVSENEIAIAEASLGIPLPEALRCWYLSVGKIEPFNWDCTEMVQPRHLAIENDKLLIATGQQNVSRYSIPEQEFSLDDPIVWRRVNMDIGWSEWAPTAETFSKFVFGNLESTDEANGFAEFFEPSRRDVKESKISAHNDAVSKAIIDVIVTGIQLQVECFGTFSGRYYPSVLDMTSPQTGEKIPRDEKVLLYFRAAKWLVDVVNERRSVTVERYQSKDLIRALKDRVEIQAPDRVVDHFFRDAVEGMLSGNDQVQLGNLGTLFVRTKAPLCDERGNVVIAGKKLLTLVMAEELKPELLERWRGKRTGLSKEQHDWLMRKGTV